MSKHSEACCNIPPIVSKDYQPKGDYITVADLKTYATGPSDAKYGILVIYDIFGFWPQTIQGADILAHSNTERSYRVFMPDFFEGNPADISWYPPDNPDKKQKLQGFLQGPAEPHKAAQKISEITEDLKQKYPSIESWGVVGYCWGAKMVSVACCDGRLFKAAAECHPAMLDVEDAKKVQIPIVILASKDEDKDVVKDFEASLQVPCHVEIYADQVHGWMAARANLDDARPKSEYERGYRTLVNFFHEHL